MNDDNVNFRVKHMVKNGVVDLAFGNNVGFYKKNF